MGQRGSKKEERASPGMIQIRTPKDAEGKRESFELKFDSTMMISELRKQVCAGCEQKNIKIPVENMEISGSMITLGPNCVDATLESKGFKEGDILFVHWAPDKVENIPHV
mmetsp:Transcript_25965/g.62547  ORF Transcript_25965/g.62547 Transcript_25965/m.62547 type:complete len:110 (-) Transcript_25965:295-624(-)|eukprot:CAMPEP_0114517568 /NCGR_PEP_ID=MMETSP0109-20121206/17966_1 /TAXON_ID=29199 /ORGANISM="Chlorarachnion reptans, Strain CCCM449" /LENGTH=109 /DNA_ID=CAMNT_0001698103 /DNA_START=70 /DNA_END=399 /DNA_ORIENTATION=+